MDVIDILKRLIACPSVTPKSAGSLEFIAELFQSPQFQIQFLPAGDVDNVWIQKGDRARLVFAGHTDVVPPGDLSRWQSDPFTPVEQDGYLHGRGAADMKSGVAAMVAAVLEAPLDGVGIFLTTDEEGRAIHGTRHFVEWWREQGNAQIDYGIVGEPTCQEEFGDAIKIGRRGSMTCRLRITGKQTHAAYPSRGGNAAHHLAAVLHHLSSEWKDNIAKQADGENVTTFQVVDIKSGVGADNVTPPFADAVFNFRFVVDDGEAALRRRCEAVFDKYAAGEWTCTWETSAEPFLMPADCNLITALQAGIKKETGVTAAPSTAGGSSDARFLRHICRELAEFGVKNETIHSPNERVCIRDVRALTAVYARLIHELL